MIYLILFIYISTFIFILWDTNIKNIDSNGMEWLPALLFLTPLIVIPLYVYSSIRKQKQNDTKVKLGANLLGPSLWIFSVVSVIWIYGASERETVTNLLTTILEQNGLRGYTVSDINYSKFGFAYNSLFGGQIESVAVLKHGSKLNIIDFTILQTSSESMIYIQISGPQMLQLRVDY